MFFVATLTTLAMLESVRSTHLKSLLSDNSLLAPTMGRVMMDHPDWGRKRAVC